METRKIAITLEKAVEWFNSGNAALQELALKAFSEKELMYDFKYITDFKKACGALSYNYNEIAPKVRSIAEISRASAAMFQLNLVRKALNLGYELSLTKGSENSYIHYPYNPFVTKDSVYFMKDLELNKMEIIGRIKNRGNLYNVLGGGAPYECDYSGLGCFDSQYGVGSAEASAGFLGCATQEIAQHFSKFFGMLITEAKFADMVDFEIVDDKYGSTK